MYLLVLHFVASDMAVSLGILNNIFTASCAASDEGFLSVNPRTLVRD
jgi:hypothetical protein